MKKISILLIALTVISVGFFSGCTEEQGTTIQTENSNPSNQFNEGDTKCINNDLYTYVGIQWVLTEKNCEECGFTNEDTEDPDEPDEPVEPVEPDEPDEWRYIEAQYPLEEEGELEWFYTCNTDNIVAILYGAQEEGYKMELYTDKVLTHESWIPESPYVSSSQKVRGWFSLSGTMEKATYTLRILNIDEDIIFQQSKLFVPTTFIITTTGYSDSINVRFKANGGQFPLYVKNIKITVDSTYVASKNEECKLGLNCGDNDKIIPVRFDDNIEPGPHDVKIELFDTNGELIFSHSKRAIFSD